MNKTETNAPKFTPGPWAVRSGVAVDDARGRWIASCARSTKDWVTESERQANARLIAAAPELYEALVQIAYSDFTADIARAKARAALAKAEVQS